MFLRFGIQTKTTLLVVAVAVAVALGTAGFLQQISTGMVESHELVDLDDESNLRAWELFHRIQSYREEISSLAADEAVRDAIYQGHLETVLDRGQAVCPRWDEYLSVQTIEAGDARTQIPILERIRGLDPGPVQEIIEVAECESRSIPLLSRIYRAEASVPVPGATRNGADVWRPEWMAVFQGCIRVPPPAGWEGPNRYLAFTFALERFRSPRHLYFLVDFDAPEQPFIVHPNMAIQPGFGRDKLFLNRLDQELEAYRDERAPLSASPIQRVAQLQSEPLREDDYFYFKEGQPTRALADAVRAKQRESPEAYDAFWELLVAEHESIGRRIGGLAGRVAEIRLLSRDPAEFRLRNRGEPNFIQQVERELRDFLGISPSIRIFHWKGTVACTRCHVSCLTITLPTAYGSHRYLMLYAAFQEEFVGAIQHEIRTRLWTWVALFGLVAMGIASTAALYFVQPIRQMTDTAHQILAEQGPLHTRLGELTSSLPVTRNDEVGDIARASERLFDEVRLNQEQLEERVRARTKELERANRQLESLAKEKDAFLANVSHELRTPLTAVSGFLQLLGRRKSLDDKEKNYVHKALAGAAYLETLIDDILDFQKIVMGGLSLTPQEFDLGEMLLELREALQFQARKNDNRLEIAWDHRLREIHTDRHRLRQVLTNLLSNACKFTRNGTVKLEAKRFRKEKEPWVRFRISDTGRGMTKEEQSCLFTRFYTNKKANESGTGLGLVISEGLCQLMGGEVRLERSQLGKGSVFIVEIPLQAPVTDASSNVDDSHPNPVPHGQDPDR